MRTANVRTAPRPHPHTLRLSVVLHASDRHAPMFDGQPTLAPVCTRACAGNRSAGYSLLELENDRKELFDTSFEDLLQQMKDEDEAAEVRSAGGEREANSPPKGIRNS